MKKYGYPFTMFIYTEGVRGGSLGGGGAITWEQLADMRDNGVDIRRTQRRTRICAKGIPSRSIEPGGKTNAGKNSPGPTMKNGCKTKSSVPRNCSSSGSALR